MKKLVLGATLAIHAAAPALADGPDLSADAKTASLRFLDAPREGEAMERSPTLHLSFGGDPVRAIMDTGSTGIVISQDAIPNVENLTTQGPGRLTYTSSGRVMVGNWVVTPVTITGADGASITTAPLPVLAVDSIECLRDARECEPTQNPERVAMMGVGFGREADRQGQSTPDKNPLLHVADMESGSMRRGYVVSRHGIQLGLSGETARGFQYVKLENNSQTGDWSGVSSCITLANGQANCGSALVDTGVTTMFLSVPAEAAANVVEDDGAGRTLADGTQVAISFGADASGPGYSFASGDSGNPAAPRKIVVVGDGDRPNFVNTSTLALNAFDVLYDSEGGWFGIRPLAN